jgi:hypothetical protein
MLSICYSPGHKDVAMNQNQLEVKTANIFSGFAVIIVYEEDKHTYFFPNHYTQQYFASKVKADLAKCGFEQNTDFVISLATASCEQNPNLH